MRSDAGGLMVHWRSASDFRSRSIAWSSTLRNARQRTSRRSAASSTTSSCWTISTADTAAKSAFHSEFLDDRDMQRNVQLDVIRASADILEREVAKRIDRRSP